MTSSQKTWVVQEPQIGTGSEYVRFPPGNRPVDQKVLPNLQLFSPTDGLSWSHSPLVPGAAPGGPPVTSVAVVYAWERLAIDVFGGIHSRRVIKVLTGLVSEQGASRSTEE